MPQPSPPTATSQPRNLQQGAPPEAGIGNARLHNYDASGPVLLQALLLTSRIFRAKCNAVHFEIFIAAL